MSVNLPSLEEPEPGATCPSCAEPLRLVGWCACGWEYHYRRDDPARLSEWRAILGLAEARQKARDREREELALEAVYRYERARGGAA